MPPTTIRDAPALDSYTPLSEHQSQTPSTFFGTKPILHFHSTSVRVTASGSQEDNFPIITWNLTEGEGNDSSVVELVEAFVNSE